jgi:hypothetical protein
MSPKPNIASTEARLAERWLLFPVPFFRTRSRAAIVPAWAMVVEAGLRTRHCSLRLVWSVLQTFSLLFWNVLPACAFSLHKIMFRSSGIVVSREGGGPSRLHSCVRVAFLVPLSNHLESSCSGPSGQSICRRLNRAIKIGFAPASDDPHSRSILLSCVTEVVSSTIAVDSGAGATLATSMRPDMNL